jgi:hypothetical protein
MKPIKPPCLKSRRDFFRKAAVMGAAALFGAAGRRHVKVASASTGERFQNQGRYRMTAHIRQYYERAAL